ncbi:NADH:flavin oxidoreductase [Caldimonas tepidiphila]|uniref:oxidoreductase n=1 Tax=Caldimonas tepidiphila TaxID=2315841 RepID=UPI000E5B530E|nr:NADH:flavin oxidoreductase [Caldimonas tepidiphila]
MSTDPNLNTDLLYQPITLGAVRLDNRIAVAPMTRTSAHPDGRATDEMARYYERFAEGGFALLITEGTYPDEAWSQGYLDQPGIANDEQAAAWRPVVERVHGAGARIVMQLMHAGAQTQGNRFKTDTVGPSAVAPRGEQLGIYRGSGPFPTPRAMSAQEIREVIALFSRAAERARDAGFDGVEVHGANGYLLDQFLTDYMNVRTDDYGGSTGNRVRLAAEVCAAVRRAVGPDFVVGVRVSQGKVSDYTYKWAGREDDARIIFGALAQAGVDYIHTTEHHASEPAWEGGQSLAHYAKQFGGGVPVMANGGLGSPKIAVRLLESGCADLVSIGKSALANRAWPKQVRERRPLENFDAQLLQPLANVKDVEL